MWFHPNNNNNKINPTTPTMLPYSARTRNHTQTTITRLKKPSHLQSENTISSMFFVEQKQPSTSTATTFASSSRSTKLAPLFTKSAATRPGRRIVPLLTTNSQISPLSMLPKASLDSNLKQITNWNNEVATFTSKKKKNDQSSLSSCYSSYRESFEQLTSSQSADSEATNNSPYKSTVAIKSISGYSP